MREWFATFGRNLTSGLTGNITTHDIEQQIREMRAMTAASEKWLATIAPGSFSAAPSLTVQDVCEMIGLVAKSGISMADTVNTPRDDFNLESPDGMLFPLLPPPQQ